MSTRPYTHFVNRKDGTGSAHDYKSRAAAMRAHSKSRGAPGVSRSYVREFDESGDCVQQWADWWDSFTERKVSP